MIEHALEIREPGHHGAASTTARCSCGGWLWSVFQPFQMDRQEAQRRLDAHASEECAQASEQARLASMYVPALNPRGGKDAAPVGPAARLAAPPRSFRDPALNVTYVNMNMGVVVDLPRGYSRAQLHAHLAAEGVVANG